MENNCKWHFDKNGTLVWGPNDSIHEVFRAKPYYSIVRESVQNSLDAVDNEQEPVRVVFEFDFLEKQLYSNLFDIKEHINACRSFHHEDVQAEKHFKPMSDYINKNQRISYLRIGDYNTTGMEFSDQKSPFVSFVRGEGKSSKPAGSGGSFGFGKGAYYVLSRIKTLLVSTKTKEGNVFFEGRTRLATHKLNEELYSRDGFYNINPTTPVSVESEIPEQFNRKEPGTDVYIIGLIDAQDRKKEIIKSVLNNFWLAIQDKKLEVEIIENAENTRITKDTLEGMIESFFTGIEEKGKASDITSWNPKSYYQAVKYSGQNDNYPYFEETLPKLGPVKLYVYLDKNLPNRVAYFRKPRMVVQKKTINILNGYVAVLLCENDLGNKLLTEMENPAHNEWKPENCSNNLNQSNINQAYKELNQFINNKLETLSKVDIQSRVAFLGLEEFLAIPEDLIEKEEDSNLPGESDSGISGAASNRPNEGETGMETSNTIGKVTIMPTIIKPNNIKEEKNIQQSEDGKETLMTGGDNESEGGDKPGVEDGDTLTSGVEAEGNTSSRVPVIINLKIAAQNEGGVWYHNLIINSVKSIAKAEIELLAGGDNEDEKGVSIATANTGIILGNILKNVQLNSGKNIIRVSFNNNIKHSLKIKAYEL